tara:strand:- start:1322 stop:2437 length:1116 start_codon:yes stop_codon:yes gene_type:complete
MRIYLTLNSSASSGFKDYTWKNIFYNTLQEMGHDVVFFSYEEAIYKDKVKLSSLSAISENIYDNFIKHHNKKKFDLFFSYYHSLNVSPELFKNLKGKVLCVNYTTNFHQINVYEDLLKEVDLSLYASIEAKSYFENKNIKSYYMPFAAIRSKSKNVTLKNGKLSFIGTAYGSRPYYIYRLLQNKFPIEIYGPNWKKSGRINSLLRSIKLQKEILLNDKNSIDTAYKNLNNLILDEINSKYSEYINDPLDDFGYTELLLNSSIILNIPESRYNHDYSNHKVLIGANLRDFEVPALGSFLLTQYNNEIATFFDPKKEIETFKNEWEMVDKTKFYLKKPNLSLKIAEAGQKRVNKQHLWVHRFENLFSHLKKNF